MHSPRAGATRATLCRAKLSRLAPEAEICSCSWAAGRAQAAGCKLQAGLNWAKGNSLAPSIIVERLRKSSGECLHFWARTRAGSGSGSGGAKWAGERRASVCNRLRDSETGDWRNWQTQRDRDRELQQRTKWKISLGAKVGWLGPVPLGIVLLGRPVFSSITFLMCLF